MKTLRTVCIVGLPVLLSGCFSDQPISLTYNNLPDMAVDSSTASGQDNGDGGDLDFNLDLDTAQGPEVIDTDYSDFSLADDSWAPGEVTSIVDETHPGWNNARCFECHGVGKPWEPLSHTKHDPRMQYWSWSCSRGFPGSACHGHGVNNAVLFNHNGAPYFYNCTKDGCHTQYNAPMKDFENHGFMRTPDEFCNACHDYFWQGWPSETK